MRGRLDRRRHVRLLHTIPVIGHPVEVIEHNDKRAGHPPAARPADVSTPSTTATGKVLVRPPILLVNSVMICNS